MIIRAFGGGELKGDKLVRFAYLDEAGISNQRTEPSVVIAGVIVHADSQWRILHEHFKSLREKFSIQDNCIFHAKDIWQGNAFFERSIWSFDRRKELLRELCLTINKFQLPVVYGHSHKENVEQIIDMGKASAKDVLNVAYMASLAECALSADKWMNKYTKGEVITLVIENNNELQKYAKAAYRQLKLPEFQKLIPGINGEAYTSIIDAPSFMDKEDAPPLQLADLCAFVIRRFLSGKDDMMEYMRILLPSMFEITEKIDLPDASAGQIVD